MPNPGNMSAKEWREANEVLDRIAESIPDEQLNDMIARYEQEESDAPDEENDDEMNERIKSGTRRETRTLDRKSGKDVDDPVNSVSITGKDED